MHSRFIIVDELRAMEEALKILASSVEGEVDCHWVIPESFDVEKSIKKEKLRENNNWRGRNKGFSGYHRSY